ncbi:plant U-box 9 [Striga asiatica]|uniref:Plant U-box 9 n=1 Tax=Striga asiatica TaxID=4170 RepID=A0A5A7PPE7_STRAF|nr:plant U-box 9 [Striga asiatica]
MLATFMVSTELENLGRYLAASEGGIRQLDKKISSGSEIDIGGLLPILAPAVVVTQQQWPGALADSSGRSTRKSTRLVLVEILSLVVAAVLISALKVMLSGK